MFFGRAVDTVGVAITFAVSLGTSAASGALIPLVSQHSAELVTSRGLLILSGISIILVGVGICGIAGRQREKEQATARRTGAFTILEGNRSGVLVRDIGFHVELGSGAWSPDSAKCAEPGRK